MTRLIDADALKSKMDGYWGRCQRIRKPRNGETAVFLDIKATVEAQPTVEAIPIEFIEAKAKELRSCDLTWLIYMWEDQTGEPTTVEELFNETN